VNSPSGRSIAVALHAITPKKTPFPQGALHMTDRNPYSPPEASIADAVDVKKRVPRTFLVLLVIYFLLEIIGGIAAGNVISLTRTAIIGIAAWRTLQGGRAASRFLGGLFTLAAALSLWSAIAAWRHDLPTAVAQVVAGALVGILAAYTFFSPSMQALYAEGDETRWRAR